MLPVCWLVLVIGCGALSVICPYLRLNPANLQLNASVTTAYFNLLAPNIRFIGISYIKH